VVSSCQSAVFQPPTPECLATICYTSGTTGRPKGVMLSHENIVSDSSVMHIFQNVVIAPSDIAISYLPLAHMFERVLENCIFMVGGQVGYYSGDIKQLMDDIKCLQPTLLPLVPRVINRIYDKVLMEVSKSGLKKFLFDWAISSKMQDLKRGIVRTDTIWDKIIFRKVREGLGGRVRFALTGSAPTSSDVLTFIRVSLGCVVLEGYGQTECVAAASVTLEGDHSTGHVGTPIPCNKMKLVDVPEMNYYSRNGCGEICIWGQNVFLGYFKDPEKTAEVLDSDGWLHTGDIGEWTSNGALKLIDRKKHIFKLSQGEYIAPEKIENVYLKSRFVTQLYVHGESLKSCLVAVVVPDAEVLQKYCSKDDSLKNLRFDQLCRNETVKRVIFNDMIAEGKKGKLFSFEQVKDIYLHPEPFSIENNLLTPTLKAKRPALKEYFKQQIAQMYVALS
ncbi:unnamed protein product, partial [Soboliphyme baturini]|uniref:long-chain-fatty-acid--CoA ligase n=1 Tax=Soboliphyme baturini TaxID=241478 RepID=A0A183I8U7_9BILA